MDDKYYFRYADEADVDLIFSWANEKSVRHNSFNSNEIKYEDHIKWYKNLLQDKEGNCQLIYMMEDHPVGQCRLRIEEGCAEIGYSIDVNYRGRGLGNRMIADLCEWVKLYRPDVKSLIGKVKPENIASSKAFINKGFKETYRAYEYKLSRDDSDEEIYLRPISYQDTNLIVKWRNQENVRRYFFYRDDFTPQLHNKWMKEKVETGKVVQFIVCMKDDNRPVGSTYLNDIDYESGQAEYGVFLGEEDVRGRGLGKAALRLTLEYAWEELGLNRIISRAISTNKASINAFLHTGFVIDEEVNDVACSDGEKVAMTMMSINRD